MLSAFSFFSRSKANSFWLIGLVYISFIGYVHGFSRQNDVFSQTAQIPSIDQQNFPLTLDCCVPQNKGFLINARPTKEGFSNCKIFFVCLHERIVADPAISTAVYDAKNAFDHHSREFLNLSILRSKHHPPTLI